MMRSAILHADTIHRSVDGGWNILETTPQAHIDRPRLLSSGVQCVGLSLWTDPVDPAPERCRRLIRQTEKLLQEAPEQFCCLTDKSRLENLGDKVGLLVVIEGAHAIADSLEVMAEFVQFGVRSLTLTWNNANSLADTCSEIRTPSGLTALGREFVTALEEWGCIIDLAHASQETFWQTLSMAPDRVWVSHTACTSLADHPRNLTDEQIAAIAQADGVIGVIFCPEFLDPTAPDSVTLDTVADHLEHMIKIGGRGCAAIGTDFDGITHLPKGMKGVEDLPLLIQRLRDRGWQEADIEAVGWENAYRVIHRALPVSSD
ncbi:MAG: membrane dipeptidase [Candidatus Eisenbacteria bacterium]|uniref:Membrane dipeptidase n=1 Tax=Eiseniibacteriota bacterium TaxID=2212470 RepID=A0A948W8C1_UNCEI|nr:membrane dipeptidase [Candidatus Eisenbacteria bacterium]MBU1950728.1 membrane dipeptidase [Candidatus Eisenbacteria bacterium]MBU2693160.1 membrane dipeptidase [Candidatus Eisenbacteria bacterium]